MATIEELPAGLEKVLAANFSPGEKIELKIKGAFKEGLVCTDRRVIIVKSGFMTGQLFGSDIFQLAYAAVASAQVKFGLLTGYFELSAGGIQNTDKSYWSQQRHSDPSKAPNCVALNSRAQAGEFRDACTFIMQRAGRQPVAAAPAPDDIAASLERLWSLKTSGAIEVAARMATITKLLSPTGKPQ
jgi:hypothetical protein